MQATGTETADAGLVAVDIDDFRSTLTEERWPDQPVVRARGEGV